MEEIIKAMNTFSIGLFYNLPQSETMMICDNKKQEYQKGNILGYRI
jgi:hypothetical protein